MEESAKAVIAFSFLLLMSLPSLPPTEGIPSVPPFKMEKARALLDTWEGWYAETPWKKSSKLDLRKKGDHCDTLPLDNLKQMYYLRLRYSMAGITEDTEVDHNSTGYFKMLHHVARSWSFYQQRMIMNPPPLRETHHFCQIQVHDAKLPEDSPEKTFRWPPDPHPLVCELNRCVSCAGAIDLAIKEACKLQVSTNYAA